MQSVLRSYLPRPNKSERERAVKSGGRCKSTVNCSQEYRTANGWEGEYSSVDLNLGKLAQEIGRKSDYHGPRGTNMHAVGKRETLTSRK